MAESIVKLRVDSSEYNSKIKRASDELNKYVENVKKSGDSLSKADKETLDFVKALGQMETQTSKARGKVKEMSDAFTELSVKYKNMTDEEKNSPFGQALSKSLYQLKTRIQESKQQLSDVNAELGNTKQEGQSTGGVLENLAGKFGMNVGQLTKFAAVAGVATTALGVAKDAFDASESRVDEWGRTVAASESVYHAFLNALNTGDIGGFLSRASAIVNAAREVYNALDRFGTMQTIQAPQLSAQQTENERFRNMIRTGRYIAPTDGRAPAPGMKAGQILTPAQIKALEGQLNNGVNKVVGLIGKEVKQAGVAVNAYYKQFGAELGMSAKEFKQGTSSMAEFDKRIRGYDLYKQFEAEHTTKVRKKSDYLGGGFSDRQVRDNAVNPYEQYKSWGVFRVDGERYQQLVNLMKERDQKASTAYGMLGQAYSAMNRAEGITVGSIMGRGGGGGVTRSRGGGGGVNTPPPPPEGSIAAQEALVQSLTKKWREASDQAGRDGYLAQLEEAKKVLEQMQGKTETLMEGSMKALNRELSDLQEAQSNVATASEWNDYEEKIKAVKKQMSELKGEVQEMATGLSGFNDNTISAWLSGQQSSLGGKEIGSADYMQTAGNIIDTQTLQNVVNATLKAGIKIDPEVIESLFEQILGGENIPDSVWQEFEDNINKGIDESNIKPLHIDVETGNVAGLGKQVKESWQDAAKAVQSVGSALQQLDDPAAKIAGIIGQAIAQIALGFAQATASDSKLGVFGWIAAIAGGLGTMISTIAAIHSATGYAEGGIVKGNSYSGDNLWGGAYVNAGELVLNRAQQGALASQLEGAGESGSMKPYTTGEYIYLGVKNHLSRSGQGEIVTTSMLKKMGLT